MGDHSKRLSALVKEVSKKDDCILEMNEQLLDQRQKLEAAEARVRELEAKQNQ